MIDLSPPPTLTVDDAVVKGLTPCQAEGDGSREVDRRRDRMKGGGKKEGML